jgi:hypothetical protein
MASIAKVGDSWRALIRRKGHKTLCKTFKAQIDRGEIVAEPEVLRLSEMIQAYRELRDQSRPIIDTANEHYMLERLAEGLGDKRRRTDVAGLSGLFPDAQGRGGAIHH